MKRIIFTLVFAAVLFTSKAQIFVGGNAGLAYSDEIFSSTIMPVVGYQITDKLAVGTGAGISIYDGESTTVFEPFVRLTAWENERVAFDVNVLSQIQLGDVTYSLTGLAPSFRFKINNRWEVTSDFGIIGAECFDGDWFAAVAVKNVGVNATILYKF